MGEREGGGEVVACVLIGQTHSRQHLQLRHRNAPNYDELIVFRREGYRHDVEDMQKRSLAEEGLLAKSIEELPALKPGGGRGGI